RFQPVQLAADAENPAGWAEIAGDAQPHGQCGGVPAACRQALEQRVARGVVVEMERLRIEFGGKRLDRILVDAQARRREFLADREILEIAHAGYSAGAAADSAFSRCGAAASASSP